MRHLGKAAAAFAVLGLLAGGGAAMAEDDVDAAIKYRKAAMKAVGGHIGGLVAVMKGDIDNAAGLPAHADGLVAATNPAMLKRAFKQNTAGKGSEQTTSNAKIWGDFARFEKAIDDMNAAAIQIQTAAAAGSLTSFDQLKPVLKECGFCHRDSGFRDKK